MHWRDRAACRGCDPGTFFPLPGDERTRRIAEEICRGCEVRLDCLGYAVDEHCDYGIWGGVASSRARVRLRKQIAA